MARSRSESLEYARKRHCDSRRLYNPFTPEGQDVSDHGGDRHEEESLRTSGSHARPPTPPPPRSRHGPIHIRRIAPITCFACGQPGHIARNCPMNFGTGRKHGLTRMPFHSPTSYFDSQGVRSPSPQRSPTPRVRSPTSQLYTSDCIKHEPSDDEGGYLDDESDYLEDGPKKKKKHRGGKRQKRSSRHHETASSSHERLFPQDLENRLRPEQVAAFTILSKALNGKG
eukprot:6492676-Amphidinium_carterae.2